MTSVHAYIRVSTTKQGEQGVSLQEQRRAIEQYCRKHELRVVEWHEEQETAASQGRRVFATLIRRLRKSHSSGLVIHKIDRGARNLKDWSQIQDLIDAGLPVHFAHESLDLNTRGGRLAADIQAVVAADYVRNLRDEVLKGINGRLQQGLWPFGAPAGYMNNGGGRPKTIDPTHGPLVREAFVLYDSGSFETAVLTTELHKRGLRNPSGGRVSQNALYRILRNEFYVGLLRMHDDVFPGVHEPLIPKTLFDRVQDRLGNRNKIRVVSHDPLYRRMVTCAHCRRRLIGEVQKGHVYYRCHQCRGTCLREEYLHERVSDAIRSLLDGPRTIEILESESESILKTREDSLMQRRQGLDLMLEQVESRLGRLTDALLDGVVDKNAYQARRESLLHERASLLGNIEDNDRAVSKAVRQFLELLRAIYDNAGSESPASWRERVIALTSNLTVRQKDVEIQWRNGIRVLANRPRAPSSPLDRDTARTVILDVIK